MNLRLWFRWTTAVALVAIAAVPTRAADADKSAKAIAPFLDDGTIAVGRLDLTKVDIPAIFKTLARFVPARPAGPSAIRGCDEVRVEAIAGQ